MSDIHERVSSDLAEQLSGKSGSAGDLRHEIETLEHDFDFDSFAPYTHQEDDVISDLEKEYWRDAEDICGDKTYKATEWEDARRAYAAALAYTAYSAIWEQAKQELVEVIEQFESDALDAKCPDTPEISLSLSCIHGWAAHNREDEEGTMYFESGQLDGCNGLARQVRRRMEGSVSRGFAFPSHRLGTDPRLPRKTVTQVSHKGLTETKS